MPVASCLWPCYSESCHLMIINLCDIISGLLATPIFRLLFMIYLLFYVFLGSKNKFKVGFTALPFRIMGHNCLWQPVSINSCCTEFILGYSYTYKCICIVCHLSTLTWHRQLKYFLVGYKDRFIIYGQHHDCWWTGDARSQGVSSHGIDLVLSGYSGFIHLTRWSNFASGFRVAVGIMFCPVSLTCNLMSLSSCVWSLIMFITEAIYPKEIKRYGHSELRPDERFVYNWNLIHMLETWDWKHTMYILMA